jgi:hypothetical protein
MTLMRGRGVKYWPAPVFDSLAFFSSSPSYKSPRPSRLAENQSSSSMDVTSLFRFLGWRIAVCAFRKICWTSSLPSLPRSTSILR